jgi:hypothetical protein
MIIRSISTILAFLVSLPLLGAKPAPRVSYEPPLGISAGLSPNLLLNAEMSVSGHWSDRVAGPAVNVDIRPEDHWACEYLPVRHQVDLAAATVISSLRVIPFWGSFMLDFKRHSKTKGWLDRMCICVEERPDHLMRGALATLANHAPEIRVASAINHPTDLTWNVDDISPVISQTTAALAKIDAVLADFTWPRGKESGIHAKDVSRINAAILDAKRTLVSQK